MTEIMYVYECWTLNKKNEIKNECCGNKNVKMDVWFE